MRKVLCVLLLTLTMVVGASCSHASLYVTKTGHTQRICKTPQLVVIGSNLPSAWEKQIEDAVDYWNAAIERDVFMYAGRISATARELGDQPLFIIVDVADDDHVSEWLDGGHVKRVGLADKNIARDGCIKGSTILIKPKDVKKWNDPKRLETLVRHELGHALGLKHSDWQTDVMYPQILKELEHPVGLLAEPLERMKKVYRP